MPESRRKRLSPLIGGLLGLVLLVWACVGIHSFYRSPTSRLPSDGFYPDMPADETHYYLNVPLDYAHPGLGSFRDFYILNPNFKRGDPVVFFLTDGQMELVDTRPEWGFFDAQLPGLSYVIIGHRGHSPTLFPQVYENGHVNLVRAMTLYGSWQRVEDVERVRLDMLAKGLLPTDGKIMIYGASGAGVLAQQYLHKHGDHASRVLLSVTGAPDLSSRLNIDYARDFAELDPDSARLLDHAAASSGINPANLAFLLFQLGRVGLSGRERQREIIQALAQGSTASYWRMWLKPSLNFLISRIFLSSPLAEAVKVRMFELLGTDLRRRAGNPRNEFHLMYQWVPMILADYLSSELRPPDMSLDRRKFNGEVLVVSALEDVVFSPKIGMAISKAYRDSKFVAVRGGHRLSDDSAYHSQVRRAFFIKGLRSPELKGLLDSSPRSGPIK